MRNNYGDPLLGGGAILYSNGIAHGCTTTNLNSRQNTIKFEFRTWEKHGKDITVYIIPKVLEDK
jgi:hypothetical protein